jgi:hypothetical protein
VFIFKEYTPSNLLAFKVYNQSFKKRSAKSFGSRKGYVKVIYVTIVKKEGFVLIAKNSDSLRRSNTRSIVSSYHGNLLTIKAPMLRKS